MYCFTAINYHDADAILDVISDYYQKHKLTLVEERIGNRSGPYANSKKWFQDLSDYEDDAFSKTRPGFTTNFDLLHQLDNVQHDWIVLFFYPDYPIRSTNVDLAVSVNAELSKLLSETLQTQVFQYSEVDTVDFYKIRLYENGSLLDFLDTAEGNIYETKGYFEANPTQSPIDATIEAYLKERGFAFIEGLEHITNENQRRPLYLKGSPENIVNFFHYQGLYA